MDELARRYLLLVLRLARHRPDVLAAWYGPPELCEAVAGEPPSPLRELHDEALRVGELVAEEPPSPRASWLAGQLRALGAVARTLDGEEIGYLDLVEELYDGAVAPEPEDTFRAAHAMLDAALQPGDTLRDRLARHLSLTALPPQAALAVARRFVDLLRRRADEDLWLPPGESIDVELGSLPDARYVGAGRSRLSIGPAPLPLLDLVALVAGETYPGRHLERATREAVLVGQRGWGEASAATRFTPSDLISSGIAEVGREVLLGDRELEIELGRIARQHAVEAEPARELVVARARQHLAPAAANAAIALHHEGAPAGRVREYLVEVALLDDDAADAAAARLADPLQRAEPVVGFAGLRLFREWLQVEGQTSGLARALTEQVTPGLLRAEAGLA